MSTNEQEGSQPTVVLVHGAFAESASWNGVIRRLQDQGYTAIAAANPLRSLSGDAQFLASILESIEGPVVLVGHSYGGSVMSNGALGKDNVKALVFVAAFAPEEGESIAELSGRSPRTSPATMSRLSYRSRSTSTDSGTAIITNAISRNSGLSASICSGCASANFAVTAFSEVRTRRSLERFPHYARHSSSLRSHYADLVGSGVGRR